MLAAAAAEGVAVGQPVSSRNTAYTVIGLVFALLIGGYFVYQISGVVLAFLLTILLSIILSAPVNYLARRGIPRTWGVLAVTAVLAVVLWLFGLAIVPAVETQSREFAEAFPTLLNEALALVNQAQSFFGLGTQIGFNPESLSNVGREGPYREHGVYGGRGGADGGDRALARGCRVYLYAIPGHPSRALGRWVRLAFPRGMATEDARGT